MAVAGFFHGLGVFFFFFSFCSARGGVLMMKSTGRGEHVGAGG
jgi:hypothetical protein